MRLSNPEKFTAMSERLADRFGLIPSAQGPFSLPSMKAYMDYGNRWTKRYHRLGGRGLAVAQCRSGFIDTLIRRLFESALVRHANEEIEEKRDSVAILAIGGYGREELCPFSDVDILFLYPIKPKTSGFTEWQKKLNDAVLYPLWDLGLKVGHSTRTARDCIAEAKADVQSKNAMLESRYLCGSEELADDFHRRYTRFIRSDNLQAYIDQRLQDQRERRERHGGTAYLQEPDLKNGVGGLRDYQNILWISRLKMSPEESHHLLRFELLQEEEFRSFQSAYDFIIRCRIELHYQSTRSTDVMPLDKQPMIAWNLKYREQDIFRRVERFMRDYYRHAEVTIQLSRYLERKFFLEATNTISFRAVLSARQPWRRDKVDGFVYEDGVLSTENGRNPFKDEPIRLVRIFRHAQQLNADIDFELERMIQENITRLTPELVESEEAARCFRSVLQTKGEVYPALVKMNETGVLTAMIPEWSKLHCLVQHEYYHRYTADQHTLATIRELDSIFSNERPEQTAKYRRALEKTELPGLLYLILLLHDIGKGDGIEGHAEVGAEMANPILLRLRVNPNLSDKIKFLIRSHLEMARFWQRYDVDDPRTVETFANLVGDVDTLRYLFALTYCDARGTSKELWNDFKDTLHSQLFYRVRDHFERPGETTAEASMTTRSEVLPKLPGISEEEIEAHYNLMRERYFMSTDAEDIALHIRMVHELLKRIALSDSVGSLAPVVEWEDDPNLGLTVVQIVTWDRAGLFAKLAGAFSVAQLNIISAKAITRADHITIDTFYVVDTDRGIVRDPGKRAKFEETLHAILVENANLEEMIEKVIQKGKPRSLLDQPAPRLNAPIPSSVNVYNELSLRRTILEIEAPDNLGLLYRIATSIYSHGFDISFARISTERSVAVDTFYIEPIDQRSTGDSSMLIALREALLETFEES